MLREAPANKMMLVMMMMRMMEKELDCHGSVSIMKRSSAQNYWQIIVACTPVCSKRASFAPAG